MQLFHTSEGKMYTQKCYYGGTSTTINASLAATNEQQS
jgi:hypothetical protein